jgi:hypothetical protein
MVTNIHKRISVDNGFNMTVIVQDAKVAAVLTAGRQDARRRLRLDPVGNRVYASRARKGTRRA